MDRDSLPFAQPLWIFESETILRMHREVSLYLTLVSSAYSLRPEAEAVWQILSAEMQRRGLLEDRANDR